MCVCVCDVPYINLDLLAHLVYFKVMHNVFLLNNDTAIGFTDCIETHMQYKSAL